MENRRAITVFAPSLEPGGAERVIVNLVNGFVKEHVKVNLILATNYASLKNRIDEEVNIIEFNHSKTIFSIFSLITYLKKNKPPIVLSHLGRANRIALLANILSGKKSKVYVVEHTTHSVAYNKLPKILRPLTTVVYKLLYPYAEKIIHVSLEAAADLEQKYKWGKGKVKVAYNPIVDENVLNWKIRGKVHKWFDNDHLPVILGAGRLIPDKNFSLLINAFSIVKKEIDARLIILGDGPEKKMLQQIINNLNLNENIDLAGYVENPLDYMKLASIFVLSSIREGLPSVIIEALACGCSVVSTNCPSGPSEILEYGKFGILVPSDEPQTMAQAIMKTIHNPFDPEVLVYRAKYFSIKRVVNRYMELLDC